MTHLQFWSRTKPPFVANPSSCLTEPSVFRQTQLLSIDELSRELWIPYGDVLKDSISSCPIKRNFKTSLVLHEILGKVNRLRLFQMHQEVILKIHD